MFDTGVGTGLVSLGRGVLISGMRQLARGEEHRRVVATSKRGNRFKQTLDEISI